MNKYQIQGVLRNIVGKVQQQAGKLCGSKEQQARGISKQAVGQAEKYYGDAKQFAHQMLKHS
jgi:uncharacterized protein YjbJ (UPF0337 family)